jgi:excisionase family DNA binding protein
MTTAAEIITAAEDMQRAFTRLLAAAAAVMESRTPVAAPARSELALSTNEAAKALSISKTALYKLMNDGTLAYKQLGRKRLVPVAELNRVLTQAE